MLVEINMTGEYLKEQCCVKLDFQLKTPTTFKISMSWVKTKKLLIYYCFHLKSAMVKKCFSFKHSIQRTSLSTLKKQLNFLRK